MTQQGYWRTEYGLIEDRTHLGLGYCTGWITTDLARAEAEASVGRSQGHKVEIKQRRVFTTEWEPLADVRTHVPTSSPGLPSGG